MECSICLNYLSEGPSSLFSPSEENFGETCTETENAVLPQNEESNLCCTPCGHPFHRECILSWLGNHKTCPCCRQEITLDKLYPLYIQLDPLKKMHLPSSKRKKSMFASLRRIFHVTPSSESKGSKELKVAVTIDISEPQDGPASTFGSDTERSQEVCVCPHCTHHNPRQ